MSGFTICVKGDNTSQCECRHAVADIEPRTLIYCNTVIVIYTDWCVGQKSVHHLLTGLNELFNSHYTISVPVHFLKKQKK